MQILYTTLKAFTPTKTEESALLEFIPAHARTRLAKFRKEEDRYRSLLGWCLLLRWLEYKGHHGSLKETIEVGQYGKPGFKATGNPDWTNGVNFNIAHDEQLVVLGVHDYDASIEILPRAGHFVGVDCMRLDRPKDELVALDEVLMDQLCPNERANVPPLQKSTLDTRLDFLRTRMDHLLAIWTTKEAYVKAIGLGLGMELNRIEVSFAQPVSSFPKSLIHEDTTAVGERRNEDQRDQRICQLCQGTIKIKVDGRDIRLETDGRSVTWHGELRSKHIEIGGEEVAQEHMVACVWTTTVGMTCGMLDMLRAEERDLYLLGTLRKDVL